MNATMSDLAVFSGLTVVTVDGFEGEPRFEGDSDSPGWANYLCELHGMAPGLDDPKTDGILWTDYNRGEEFGFSVLLASHAVDSFRKSAASAGYTVVRADEVAEPTNFGDGLGTVEILKHRDGWVLIEG